MSFTFNPINEEKIGKLWGEYPKKEALTLPMLWMAQYQEGSITPEAIRTIAARLELSPSYIFGIATFYTMFRLSPVGIYHIELCQTLSCALCGKDELITHLGEKWGIYPGQTTQDGRFTLSLVECLGACGGAPMLSLNETYHENVTTESLDALLEGLS